MRATVIVCDRCERRIGDEEAIALEVSSPSSNGGRRLRRELDLCDGCARRVLGVATGDHRAEDRRTKAERERDEATTALAGVRELAAEAVAGYNVGAGCDELLEALRDVASGANRRALSST